MLFLNFISKNLIFCLKARSSLILILPYQAVLIVCLNFMKKKADFIACEGRDFIRYSYVKENPKAVLVTAIAKPFRLYEHFIKARACYFFKDHYEFKKEELQALLDKHHCDTLMLTFKDYVKVKDFGFKCQIIELNIELKENFKEKLYQYIRSFNVAS